MNHDLIAALNAERYGTGQWFTSPLPGTRPRSVPPKPAHDDSDTATARRRRDLLAADSDFHYAKEA